MDKVALPLKIERNKRIILEKNQKNKEERTGSWIKLEEPVDERNFVEIGEKGGKRGKTYQEKGIQYVCRKVSRCGGV